MGRRKTMTPEEAREKRLAYGRAYYYAHREELAEKKKAWEDANRDKVNAMVRRYREAHPEKIADIAHRAYVKRRDSGKIAEWKQTQKALKKGTNPNGTEH